MKNLLKGVFVKFPTRPCPSRIYTNYDWDGENWVPTESLKKRLRKRDRKLKLQKLNEKR